ncbi:MAG: hypothetical protein LBE81_03490 [Azonexus sp.]|uniref:hypothetical protein n=1 Tax=Azonexus sp. TaxID=1872668 RepID=UPI0028262829|nr:hypothetical protein [Azonexus sp.]MDR0775687.1 hypothetical protein [Azonexus sp.]
MKIIASLLLFLLAATLAVGEESGETSDLGRLFLTPQQRQILDQQRLRDPNEGGERRVTVSGEVRRSGGATTRWINGQADWSGTGPRPKVPVGDSFDPATGSHQPLLDSGQITIKRTAPP